MPVIDRALLLHQDASTLRELREALSEHLPCDTAADPAEAMRRFEEKRHAVVVVQHDPPALDRGALIVALAQRSPETVVIAVSRGGVSSGGGLAAGPAGHVYRFLGAGQPGLEIAGMVLDGLRLARLEREQREIVRRLGGAEGIGLPGGLVAGMVDGRAEPSLTRDPRGQRERLLDLVVRERTRELEQAYARLKAANRQLLMGLAEAIEVKDSYTKGHCGRVANYTVALAGLSGFAGPELELVEYASFLHDLGKIGVRDAVLQKPGPLGDDEWRHMRLHPVLGDDIAAQIEMLQPMRPAIRSHHERWDGSGYPDGLSGEDIPVIARIVAIADSFDAMITERPYKDALPFDECYRLLRRGAGKYFDPSLVDAFIRERIGEELAYLG